MRTTLTIDDDVLAAARHLAVKQQKNLGEVISELARQGLQKPGSRSRRVRNGIPLLNRPATAVPVTLELVNQLRDEQP